jgi:DNA-binding CsgD family transcriptional regulator
MFEDRQPFTSPAPAPDTGTAPPRNAAAWRGPERRDPQNRPLDGVTDWRFLLLNEVDYGIVVLDWDGLVLYVNQVARGQLKTAQALRLERGTLVAANARDASLLTGAVRAAAVQGLRRMVRVGERPHPMALAVVPGPYCTETNSHRVLVMLPRGQLCEPLSAYAFARDHRLSAAESRVLQQLCDGCPPGEIAERQGVAIATVRSQIASIRTKTDTANIGDLIHRVARLPPIRSTLPA